MVHLLFLKEKLFSMISYLLHFGRIHVFSHMSVSTTIQKVMHEFYEIWLIVTRLIINVRKVELILEH